MPVSLRTTVDTSLPASEALEGLLRPGLIPGRKILRHDPAEVVYQEGADVTTHLVLLKAFRAARAEWMKDPAEDEEVEGEEAPAPAEGATDRLTGHVTGPFGEVWFTLRAIPGGERTRLELEGSYEPKGLLLRMQPKRSARQLSEEFTAGLKLALAREEGRLEGIVEAATAAVAERADAPEESAS